MIVTKEYLDSLDDFTLSEMIIEDFLDMQSDNPFMEYLFKVFDSTQDFGNASYDKNCEELKKLLKDGLDVNAPILYNFRASASYDINHYIVKTYPLHAVLRGVVAYFDFSLLDDILHDDDFLEHISEFTEENGTRGVNGISVAPFLKKGYLDIKKVKEIAELLIQAGADMNKIDSWGRTPFSCAFNCLANGKESELESLLDFVLEKGAKLQLTIPFPQDEYKWDYSKDYSDGSCEQQSTLSWVPTRFVKNMPLIKRLLDAGADINEKGWRGNTLFSDSVKFRCDEIKNKEIKSIDINFYKELLDLGANVNHISRKDTTPIFGPIWAHQLPLIKLLVENGADVNHKVNEYKVTPLDEALGKNNKKIVEYLISKGAKKYEEL